MKMGSGSQDVNLASATTAPELQFMTLSFIQGSNTVIAISLSGGVVPVTTASETLFSGVVADVASFANSNLCLQGKPRAFDW